MRDGGTGRSWVGERPATASLPLSRVALFLLVCGIGIALVVCWKLRTSYIVYVSPRYT